MHDLVPINVIPASAGRDATGAEALALKDYIQTA
jgi:hypothetical protein